MDAACARIYPNDGPIGADSNLDFWLGTVLMAVPLTGLLAVLAVFASEYLKRAQATGRTRTAWTAGVIAAVGVDLAFLGTFAAPGRVFGMKLGQVNWGLVVLSAIFVVIGVAMIAVLTVGVARLTPRQSASSGAQEQLAGFRQAGRTDALASQPASTGRAQNGVSVPAN